MTTYTLLFVLLTVTYECSGHLPKLTDIIAGAHQQIHSQVGNVANSVLGGLTHGLNLNFEGHVGFNQARPGIQNPQYANNGIPQNKPVNDETIVVVVEETSQNEFRPPNINSYAPPHRDQHNPDYNNNNYSPNYNGQGVPDHGGNGNFNPNGNFNHYNHGNPNQNNYGNSGQDGFNVPHQSEHQNQDKPTTEKIIPEQKPTNPSYGNVVNPSTEASVGQVSKNPNENVNEVNKENDKSTKKPVDDQPLFVPLNPNQYVYGGDKINVTAPKRETNDSPKPAENSDDEFPIDIRFQKE